MPEQKLADKKKTKSSCANYVQGIDEPNENDVLCGRGDIINSHAGNKNFRKLVNKYKKVYKRSQFNRDKRMIASRIMAAVRELNPPGRFLAKDSKLGLWHEIGDKKALEKTSQTLREKSPGASGSESTSDAKSKQTSAAPALKEDTQIKVETKESESLKQPMQSYYGTWSYPYYHGYGYPPKQSQTPAALPNHQPLPHYQPLLQQAGAQYFPPAALPRTTNGMHLPASAHSFPSHSANHTYSGQSRTEFESREQNTGNSSYTAPDLEPVISAELRDGNTDSENPCIFGFLTTNQQGSAGIHQADGLNRISQSCEQYEHASLQCNALQSRFNCSSTDLEPSLQNSFDGSASCVHYNNLDQTQIDTGSELFLEPSPLLLSPRRFQRETITMAEEEDSSYSPIPIRGSWPSPIHTISDGAPKSIFLTDPTSSENLPPIPVSFQMQFSEEWGSFDCSDGLLSDFLLSSKKVDRNSKNAIIARSA